MKLKLPDDDECEFGVISDQPKKEEKKSFQEEMKDILKIEKIPSKFVFESSDHESPEYKHQFLLKFTEICREEMIPRHVKATDAIQSRVEEMHCQMICQKKDLDYLNSCKQELKESMEQLESSKKLALTKHQDLSVRLKETLSRLQDRCKSKTMAEVKMAEDLINYKNKITNLKVKFNETVSTKNYYKTQVKAQTNIERKQTKPLYLDKNRVVFLRENLSSMRQNIEDMIHRVKILETEASELTEPEYSEHLSVT